MNQSMTLNENGKVTSLELVEQINFFREGIDGKNPLRHDTLRNIIKDEFDEELKTQEILGLEDEISLHELGLSKYTNSRGREYDMYGFEEELDFVTALQKDGIHVLKNEYVDYSTQQLSRAGISTEYIISLDMAKELLSFNTTITHDRLRRNS